MLGDMLCFCSVGLSSSIRLCMCFELTVRSVPVSDPMTNDPGSGDPTLLSQSLSWNKNYIDNIQKCSFLALTQIQNERFSVIFTRMLGLLYQKLAVVYTKSSKIWELLHPKCDEMTRRSLPRKFDRLQTSNLYFFFCYYSAIYQGFCLLFHVKSESVIKNGVLH